MKYRLVYEKIRQGILAGAIGKETTLLEASAGSTGVALAYAGSQLGLKVDIHVYEGDTPKYQRIKHYGARLVVHDKTKPFPVLLNEMLHSREKQGIWHLNQYDRASVILSYRDYAFEIMDQLATRDIQPEQILCAVGTGGLLQGIGTAIRGVFPNIKITACEPESGCEIDGMRNADDFHLGDDDPYDKTFPDQRIFVQPVLRESGSLGDGTNSILNYIKSSGISNYLLISPD